MPSPFPVEARKFLIAAGSDAVERSPRAHVADLAGRPPSYIGPTFNGGGGSSAGGPKGKRPKLTTKPEVAELAMDEKEWKRARKHVSGSADHRSDDGGYDCKCLGTICRLPA
jgi:hypothetical protein